VGSPTAPRAAIAAVMIWYFRILVPRVTSVAVDATQRSKSSDTVPQGLSR
jgi:hypothetical protein